MFSPLCTHSPHELVYLSGHLLLIAEKKKPIRYNIKHICE